MRMIAFLSHLLRCIQCQLLKVVISCRKGPWHGQAYYWIIRSTVLDYCTNNDFHEATFRACYHVMAVHHHKGRLPCHYGSDEHMEYIFDKFRQPHARLRSNILLVAVITLTSRCFIVRGIDRPIDRATER